MTPQERDVLLPLLDKLRQTQLAEKDPEADQLIRQTMISQPDLAYILTQTVLMQDYALHAAQTRIQQLEKTPQSSGSFLGNLFGGGRSAQPQSTTTGPWGGQPQAQPYAQPMASAVQTGQPSFLRSAAQTAAGIAGGALLFQGIESLFGGRGGFGGGGFLNSNYGAMGGPAEVINNYYEVPPTDTLSDQNFSDADFPDTGFDDNSGFDV